MSLKMPTVKWSKEKWREEKWREEKNITDLELGPDKINSVQFKLFYFIFFSFLHKSIGDNSSVFDRDLHNIYYYFFRRRVLLWRYKSISNTVVLKRFYFISLYNEEIFIWTDWILKYPFSWYSFFAILMIDLIVKNILFFFFSRTVFYSCWEYSQDPFDSSYSSPEEIQIRHLDRLWLGLWRSRSLKHCHDEELVRCSFGEFYVKINAAYLCCPVFFFLCLGRWWRKWYTDWICWL